MEKTQNEIDENQMYLMFPRDDAKEPAKPDWTPTPAKHLHRRNGPETSAAAAHSIDATALEVMVLTAIEESGKNGLTQDELLERFDGYSYSSITARPAALKRKELISDSGRKRRGRSGRNQAVLVATKYLALENHDRPVTDRPPYGTNAPCESCNKTYDIGFYYRCPFCGAG